jgi:hypothetical protein
MSFLRSAHSELCIHAEGLEESHPNPASSSRSTVAVSLKLQGRLNGPRWGLIIQYVNGVEV